MFIEGVGDTRVQVLFLERASNSCCIADFHLGLLKVSVTEKGTSVADLIEEGAAEILVKGIFGLSEPV